MRGNCAVNLAFEAEACRHRKASAVIDVRVRDDDRIKRRKVDARRDGVARFISGRALKHAEINENSCLWRGEQRATARDFTSCTVKLNCRANAHRVSPTETERVLERSKISSIEAHHSPSRAQGAGC